MTPQEIRNKVNGLYATIKQADADLEAVREKCTHSEYRIGLYSWGPGHMHNTRLCNYCDKNMGYGEGEITGVLTSTSGSCTIDVGETQ